MRRTGGAVALAATMTLVLAGCGGEGEDRALPSERPSATRTVTTDPTRTALGDAEPTRTQDAEPTRTQDAEPTRTQDAEPTRTQDAEPTRTQDAEPTRTTEQADPPEEEATTRPPQTNRPVPTTTTEPAPTTEAPPTTEPAEPATTPASEPAAVPVSDADDAGYLGWLLLFILLGGTIAIVVVSRSRRDGVWDAQGSALAAETRSITEVRLPPLLTALTASERGLIWPPVREDLNTLAVRWATLAERAPDDARQASAGEIAMVLRDLVPAIDAENESLAAGRDWRMLRPRVTAILDALNAIMQPRPAPAPPTGGAYPS